MAQTKQQLKDALDAKGITYNAKATNAELEALLKGKELKAKVGKSVDGEY
jgi:hypothetical protein